MENTIRVKKSLIALFTLQLWISTPLSATYELDDIDPERYQTHYNKLPTVEESDRLLKDRSVQFSRFLEDAEKIVVDHGMEAVFGLRLVHRHFAVKKGQFMVEEQQSYEGTSSLITYAHDLEDAKARKALPSSWIFSEDKAEDPLVFETSADPAVRTGIELLKENPGFMDEMGELLRATQFNSLISLALLRRDSLVPNEEEAYLEINSADLSKSIVQLWDAKKKPQNTIRTSWSFKGPRQSWCLATTCCVFIPDLGHGQTPCHQSM